MGGVQPVPLLPPNMPIDATAPHTNAFLHTLHTREVPDTDTATPCASTGDLVPMDRGRGPVTDRPVPERPRCTGHVRDVSLH